MPSDLPPGSPADVPPPSPAQPLRRSPPTASPLRIGLAESSWFLPAHAPANVAVRDWHGTIDADAELKVVGTERTARLRPLDAPLKIWSDQCNAARETGLWSLLHGSIRGALREELADRHVLEVSDRLHRGVESLRSLCDATGSLRLPPGGLPEDPQLDRSRAMLDLSYAGSPLGG